MNAGRNEYSHRQKVLAVENHEVRGMTCSEAMESVGCRSKSAFFRWLQEYRAGGRDALRPGRRGRPPKAKEEAGSASK